MAYLPNIPQSTDQLSISQGNILNNFTILGAIAGNANPSSDSINSTAGFNWILLPSQGAIPPSGAAFPAGNIGLYSATSTITTKNELYINKTNQATVVQIPSTASILSLVSAPTVFSSGWTYLPSGILLKWGGNITANGLLTVTFPASANIPAFTTCLTVLVTLEDGTAGDANRSIRLQNVTPIDFSVYGSFRTTTGAASSVFTYLAIGY